MAQTIKTSQTKKYFLIPGNTAQILPLQDNETDNPSSNAIIRNKTPMGMSANKDKNINFGVRPPIPVKPILPNPRIISTPKGRRIETRTVKIHEPAKPKDINTVQNPRRAAPKASAYVFLDKISSLPSLNAKKAAFHDHTPLALQLLKLADRPIRQIAASQGSINVVTDNNKILVAETVINEERNSFVDFATPNSLNDLDVLSVSCGSQHTVVCAASGSNFVVLGSGDNTVGQLGFGNSNSNYSISNVNEFKVIKTPSRSRFHQVCCGNFFTFLLTDTAEVYCMGHNNHGQLGLGNQANSISEPTFCMALLGVPVISMAAGSSHSLALSATGVVFGAGSNKQGQLGISNQDDQYQFIVFDSLASVHIVHIAAYECVSAAIDEFGTLYVWGCQWGKSPNALTFQSDGNTPEKIVDVALGDDGRIAVLTARNKLIVSGFFVNGEPIKIPVDIISPSSAFVKLFSGGEYFFALTSSSKLLPLIANNNYNNKSLLPPTPIEIKDKLRPSNQILALNTSHLPTFFDLPSAQQVLGYIFASLSAINACFLIDNFTEDMASISSGVAIGSVLEFYNQLMKHDELMNCATVSFNELLSDLQSVHLSIRRPTTLRFLIVALFHPSPIEYKQSFLFWANLVMTISKLNAYSILTQWISVLNEDEIKHILKSIKDFIAVLASETNKLYSTVMFKSIKTLEMIWYASTRSKKLSFDMFYHETINKMIDLEEEHSRFTSEQSPWCFATTAPYVLDADSKTKFLHEISQAVMFNRQLSTVVEAANFFGNIPVLSPLDLFFVVKVKRDTIIQDTFTHICLLKNPDTDLKKPLKVIFENEPAVDAGGVQREFFELIVNQLLDPNINIFITKDNFIWFNKDSNDPTALQTYYITGILVGLAIFNGNLINIRFPNIVYKKLKGQTVTLSDLRELDSQLYNTLQSILSYQGDVENDMCLTYEYEGIPLIANGNDIPVTNRNREEYVNAVANYILNQSIASQFNSFKEGFLQAAGKIALNLFRPEELALLIAGREELDFYALMKATQYEGGFNADSPPVAAFWRIVFNRLTEEEKKKLLYFVTASPRAPIGGLGKVPFVIAKDGNRDHIPTSHTCYFMLVLPDEPDEDEMYKKLKIAIENSEGFAFK
ncbi:hypothetical protein TRFO_10251 [Tritrichomonas foetus]|uniref:HECT domain-containing protein n=1 Tax=Tritrichomonas foetus TaxID=1144522 RepID=A0A1J4JF16_9EUKA|nr:hypothetical protein TRFO_10251 [Tritrichomonas foetus]|eukprot:OHS95852.1 hypothetical protein TRFO_10251 [Tritrichomonas foetus]